MKRISNYHTHIYLCKHANGTVEDIVKRAIDLNYQIIGISDHGFLNVIKNTRRMNYEEYQNIYLKDVHNCINKYQDKIKIKKAVEVEYFPMCLKEYQNYLNDLDYLILGQHDIIINNQFKSIYDKTFSFDDAIIYLDMVCEALETGYFKIFAHPDIFMFQLKEFNDVCMYISQKIIEKAHETNTALEINANGLRQYLKIDKFHHHYYKYPNPHFWNLVSLYQKEHPDLKVIISDDAHDPKYLSDEYTLMAYEFAEKKGIKITEILDF